jgi:hypothetical protein
MEQMSRRNRYLSRARLQRLFLVHALTKPLRLDMLPRRAASCLFRDAVSVKMRLYPLADLIVSGRGRSAHDATGSLHELQVNRRRHYRRCI